MRGRTGMAMRAVAGALRRMDLGEVQRLALRAQAEALAADVRAVLPAGEAVGVQADEASAVVGSAGAHAAAREFGRPGQPPRPVLGAAGAARGGRAAEELGAAVAEAIRRAVGGA
jgi:hypothetical protein